MKLIVIDACVIAAIIACTYYISSQEKSSLKDDLFEDGMGKPLEETIAIQDGFHPSRNCNTSANTASVLVVDITYSGLTPIGPTQTDNEFGDLLLDNLFEVLGLYIAIDLIAKSKCVRKPSTYN